MKIPTPRQVLSLLAAGGCLLTACGSSDPEQPPERAEKPAEPADPVESAPPREGLVSVPGTGVMLVPPDGFAPAVEFPGFGHEESGTSIMVTEVPGPYAQVSAGFRNAGQLARQGMQVHESKEHPYGEHPGLLLRLTQTVPEMTVEKWCWVFGTPKKTVMLMGTCMDEAYLPAVHDAILSATWDPDREFDVTEGLGFELTETRGLALWQRMGNTLIYSADGEPDFELAGKPMLTIGPATGSGEVADRRAFVEERVRQLPLQNVEIRTVDPVEIDGLPGLALVAAAEDDATGAARIVYQVILFEADNYWIGVGLAALDYEDEYIPIFRRAISSLRRADAGD